MSVQPGEFWVADIRYTDGKASKIRPILVLWLDGLDAVVCVVTTSGPRSIADVRFADWKSSGLRAASTVRLARLDCLEQSLLIRRLGVVSAVDASVLTSTWAQHVKPHF